MAEQIDLTIPDQATTGTMHYWLNRTELDREGARVTFCLGSSGGYKRVITLTGADALTYMKALNKRNASVVSNDRWTLNLLISKDYFHGTVSGAPD